MANDLDKLKEAGADIKSLLDTLDFGVDLEEPCETRRTLLPASLRETLEAVSLSTDSLPELALGGGAQEGELLLKDSLGQGGMGEVWLAEQVPLARDVAVKRIRPERRNTGARRSILREAWVTGRLEHPNIIPIHALGADAGGDPIIVMKRIEGVCWEDALCGKATLPARYAELAPLEAHIRILMEVCDAVHFAHTRGVLHRDLKPDNVMLGAFGEVYLVDWGIAVSLRPDPRGRLPSATEVSAPAGTPAYMSPEMADGKGDALGVHSDVFSLGATLHQIVTGQTRHQGASYLQLFYKALFVEPFEYDLDEVPEELAAICNRATARDPAERHESVEAFRAELAAFLEHSDSRRLVKQARQMFEALKEAVGAEEPHKVRELFGACHFGYRQAAEIWPDNPQARDGRCALLLTMAEFELQHRHPEAAAHLVGELPGDAQASEQVVRLKADIEAQRQELDALQSLRHETDLSIYSRRRGVLAFGLAMVWAGNAFRRSADLPEHVELVTNQFVMMGLVGALMIALRRWLFGTLINRKIASVLGGVLVMDLVVRWLGWHLRVPIFTLASMEMVVDTAGVLYLALLIDLRLLAATAAMAAGVVCAAYFPERIYTITACSNLLTLLVISGIWFWRPPEDPR